MKTLWIRQYYYCRNNYMTVRPSFHSWMKFVNQRPLQMNKLYERTWNCSVRTFTHVLHAASSAALDSIYGPVKLVSLKKWCFSQSLQFCSFVNRAWVDVFYRIIPSRDNKLPTVRCIHGETYVICLDISKVFDNEFIRLLKI